MGTWSRIQFVIRQKSHVLCTWISWNKFHLLLHFVSTLLLSSKRPILLHHLLKTPWSGSVFPSASRLRKWYIFENNHKNLSLLMPWPPISSSLLLCGPSTPSFSHDLDLPISQTYPSPGILAPASMLWPHPHPPSWITQLLSLHQFFPFVQPSSPFTLSLTLPLSTSPVNAPFLT